MTFDPFNPFHWTYTDEGSLDSEEVVAKADYDKLLELYKEAKEEADIHSTQIKENK
jgi:hypothetical protein